MALNAPDWLVARPIAHRGLHDLSAGFVENTLAAANAALDAGFAIECDLQLSADGEVFVFHDDVQHHVAVKAIVPERRRAASRWHSLLAPSRACIREPYGRLDDGSRQGVG